MPTPRMLITYSILSLALMVFVGPAAAECLPGQVHEADLAYQNAVVFYNDKNYDEAIPRLASILDICDEHVPTLTALAMAYSKAKRYEEAKVAYENLIERKGDDASGKDYGSLGGILARLKLYPQARSALVRAQILDPDNCAILFNLGMAYKGEQNFRKAVETLEEGVDKCPDIRSRLLPELAKACGNAASRERTMGNVERAEYYEGKNQQYAGQAGGTTAYDQVVKAMREGNYGAAVGVLNTMLEGDPEHKSALLSMARCKAALNQPGQAIPYYNRYLVINPDDYSTTSDLIRSYTESGDVAGALAKAREAETHFRPMGRRYLAAVYYAWGMALEKSSDYAAAKAMFEKVPGCGDPEWTGHARQQIERQDGLIRQEEHRARQGG